MRTCKQVGTGASVELGWCLDTISSRDRSFSLAEALEPDHPLRIGPAALRTKACITFAVLGNDHSQKDLASLPDWQLDGNVRAAIFVR